MTTTADRVETVVRAHVQGIAPEHIARSIDAPDCEVRTALRLLLDAGRLYLRADGRVAVVA